MRYEKITHIIEVFFFILVTIIITAVNLFHVDGINLKCANTYNNLKYGLLIMKKIISRYFNDGTILVDSKRHATKLRSKPNYYTKPIFLSLLSHLPSAVWYWEFDLFFVWNSIS